MVAYEVNIKNLYKSEFQHIAKHLTVLNYQVNNSII